MRTLVFVDDHPIYREGLRRSLAAAVPDLDVKIADGTVAVMDLLATSADIDLCLSDYRLADGDGLSLLGTLRQRFPMMAVGLLCADPTPLVCARARALGAVACLSKDRDVGALAEAIDALFNGGTQFDETHMVDTGFSLRRREILSLAAEGLLDKQISDRLGISESTVRNHWQHLFLKLEVSNRTEAVGRAIRRGLI